MANVIEKQNRPVNELFFINPTKPFFSSFLCYKLLL